MEFVFLYLNQSVVCNFGPSTWRLLDVGVTPQEHTRSPAHNLTSIMAVENDTVVVVV